MRNTRTHVVTRHRAAGNLLSEKPAVQKDYAYAILREETCRQDIAGEPVSQNHVCYKEENEDMGASTVFDRAAGKNLSASTGLVDKIISMRKTTNVWLQ